ncbi:MAG: patatin-like phospholipase family protein [Saprospiraceae bacterium]
MTKQKDIGIVLSGGGARGVAHAGILKALKEQGVEPMLISGSSVGAMVGALYAAGHESEQITEFFKQNTNIFRWQFFSRKMPGFLDMDNYADVFSPWLQGHNFESLSKELHICVTDVLKGESRFFSSGELVRPILASAAVPGVFSPVEIDDDWYIDGGTMNNLPVEPLLDRCKLLFGSYVSPHKIIQKTDLSNTLKLINRANDLGYYASSLNKFRFCDFVFVPQKLENYGLFDVKKLDEIFEVGYKYANEVMKDFMPLIEKSV